PHASARCIFFFQAEDGIRDFHVTGVQTCALPIYPHTAEEERDAAVHFDACADGDAKEIERGRSEAGLHVHRANAVPPQLALVGPTAMDFVRLNRHPEDALFDVGFADPCVAHAEIPAAARAHADIRLHAQ